MRVEIAKPKETSYEYGKSHQEVMVGYYHESKIVSPTNNEYLRVRLALDLVNEHAVPRFGKPKEELTVVDVACSVGIITLALRSEERRVGKECRSRWSQEYEKRYVRAS